SLIRVGLRDFCTEVRWRGVVAERVAAGYLRHARWARRSQLPSWPIAAPTLRKPLNGLSQDRQLRRPMLRLRTLGGISLESDTGALGAAAVQRRRLAILALLATSRDRGDPTSAKRAQRAHVINVRDALCVAVLHCLRLRRVRRSDER